MARDLYGEMLGRALTRQAPPGHMPAYITPGEAQQLRAVGGGVTPGGGQVMAGGVPAFPPPGAYAAAMRRPVARGVAPRGLYSRVRPSATGLRSALGMPQTSPFYQPRSVPPPGMSIPGTDMFTRDQGVLEDFTAAGEARRAEALFKEQAGRQRYLNAVGAAARDAAAPAPRADTAGKPRLSNEQQQPINLAAAVDNPNLYDKSAGKFTPAGVEHLAKNISEGGLGRWSPGATLLANNREAPAGVVAHVMQQSPRRGQGAAIFDPRGNVSVPPGYNMGLGPSALMTLGGLAAGGPAGAAITGMKLAARAPGLGRLIGDEWIDRDLPGSGLIEWKRDLQEKVGLGGIRDSERGALADILSGVGTGAERAPQPFQQPSWYPGEAQFASAMPESDELLLEAEEAAAAEAAAAEAAEPFATDVPQALLDRLRRTAAYGQERIEGIA
jgi:hypothetical protein